MSDSASGVGGKDQDHLNYAYDAFRDLADLIGIDPTGIGLGGTLHFTIGALGHGRHSAHYQDQHPHPDGGTVPVINVTNTKGDGTVAHEWMHALDYHLRRTAEGKDAINTLKRALTKKYDIETIRALLPAFFKGHRHFPHLNKRGRKATRIEQAQHAVTYHSRGTRTDFYTAALALGKDYWANDMEPFARAGESWVYDDLAGRNDYLVSEWVTEGKVTKPPYRGTPYPTGDERTHFGEWYKALFASARQRSPPCWPSRSKSRPRRPAPRGQPPRTS